MWVALYWFVYPMYITRWLSPGNCHLCPRTISLENKGYKLYYERHSSRNHTDIWYEKDISEGWCFVAQSYFNATLTGPHYSTLWQYIVRTSVATFIPTVVRKSDVHRIFMCSVNHQVSLPVHHYIQEKRQNTQMRIQQSMQYCSWNTMNRSVLGKIKCG